MSEGRGKVKLDDDRPPVGGIRRDGEAAGVPGARCRLGKRRRLLANPNARTDPAVAVPVRLTQRPVATGRRPIIALLRRTGTDDAADHAAEDGRARIVTVMVMVVVMMVVLGKLDRRRLLPGAGRVVGAKLRHRVGDGFKKVPITCRRRSLGCSDHGRLSAADGSQGRRCPQ